MARLKLFILIIIAFIPVISCSPINFVTTAPALALGAYDTSEKRAKWLEYANKGDVYAQYELAKSYCCNEMEGSIDKAESAKWFCTAAKNGFARAQIEIGKFYEGISTIEGMNYPQDNVKAFAWYSMAARRAVSEGMDRRKELKAKLSDDELRQAEKLLLNYQKLECIPQ